MKAPLHERLIARHPLAPADAATYAKRASDAGTDGPWWRIWRAIVRANGHRLRDAVATLDPSQRRWFALWSFARGRLREGIVAYRTYLTEPGPIGPFDAENAAFLRHVIAVRGSAAALAERVPSGTLVDDVVLSLLAEHRPAELLDRAPAPSGTKLHSGSGWARHAIALAKNGDPVAAGIALDRAAKLLRRASPELEQLLLSTFALAPEAWAERRKPWGYSAGDANDRWRAHLGGRVVKATHESPHSFGGADFELPTCKGCGHREHQFFCFDVASIPDLQARIPNWQKLPLVHCIDCSMWMTRRDYRINASRIETIAVSGELGRSSSTLEPIPRQAVDVVPISGEEPGTDRTQIGGEPDWVQDAERLFCPGCWNELAFVAALGSTSEPWFEPSFTVNNGSGNQYYFACNDCHVLSVIGQNT